MFLRVEAENRRIFGREPLWGNFRYPDFSKKCLAPIATKKRVLRGFHPVYAIQSDRCQSQKIPVAPEVFCRLSKQIPDKFCGWRAQ